MKQDTMDTSGAEDRVDSMAQQHPLEQAPLVSVKGEATYSTLGNAALAAQCLGELSTYRRGEPCTGMCSLELLRLATVQGDPEAWVWVRHCFREVVLDWLHRHPSREAACRLESEEHYVAQTFELFCQATTVIQRVEFSRLAPALQYLRASLNGAILNRLRAHSRPRAASLPEPPVENHPDSSELWEILQTLLLNEREQRLAFLLFHCGLSPREIVRCCPQEWSDIQEIYRLRHTILERVLPQHKEDIMMKSTFWTQRRFTGIVLLVGCLLYVGAGALLPKDTQGNYVVNLAVRDQLLVIAAHPQLWQWDIGFYISGAVVLLLGLAMLTMLLWDAGDRVFSPLALIAFLLGSVLMAILLAFHLGVDPVAAQETARTGVMPSYYLPLQEWTQVLFVIYTVLAFSALAAYGGAVLSTRVLPHWVGWLAIVYGLAGLGLVGVTGDADPFLHLVLPVVIGILLLLRRYQVPAGSQREEGSIVASTTVVKEGKR